MISFKTDCEKTARDLLERIKLITYAESLGGVESLMTYPMLQTHGDLPKEVREKLGITEDFIRFSVGIENVDDLLVQTKAKTIEFLQEHLEEQSLLFTKKRCQNTINNICNQPTSTIEEYKASLGGVVDIVNPQEEYNKVREELQKIIDDKDYLAALKVINNKGLLPSTNLPNVFGWKKQYYIEYVIRLLESKDSASEELCDIFREYVPVEI